MDVRRALKTGTVVAVLQYHSTVVLWYCDRIRGAFKTVASTVATTDRVFVTVGSGREQDVSCLHAG